MRITKANNMKIRAKTEGITYHNQHIMIMSTTHGLVLNIKLGTHTSQNVMFQRIKGINIIYNAFCFPFIAITNNFDQAFVSQIGMCKKTTSSWKTDTE